LWSWSPKIRSLPHRHPTPITHHHKRIICRSTEKKCLTPTRTRALGSSKMAKRPSATSAALAPAPTPPRPQPQGTTTGKDGFARQSATLQKGHNKKKYCPPPRPAVGETKWTRYWAAKRAERIARLPENQGKHGELGKDFGKLGAADRSVNAEGGKFGELGKRFGELGEQFGGLGEQFGDLGAADRSVNAEGGQFGDLGKQFGELGKQFGELGAADPELNLLGAWRTNAPRFRGKYCVNCGAPSGTCRHVPQRYTHCWCGERKGECAHEQPVRRG
jgi:hypothetical protein